MMNKVIELPLFPLNLVLFPGTMRPLHVFEPRYLQMVKDCLDEQKPLGIVLMKDENEFLYEETYTVGTIADIHNIQRLADGCYNLVAVGTQRFRILSFHREKPYISALVEPFNDQPERDILLQSSAEQVRSLFLRYLNMLLDSPEGQDIEVALPEDSEGVSHFIAYFLDIDDEKKQQLLELTSTSHRIQEEINFLRREVPFMHQILFNEPPKERIMLN